MNSQMWIDEVDFFQRDIFPEATSLYANMWEILANSSSWIKAEDQKQARRTYEKVKRRKEQENCQHGHLSYPITWSTNVRPIHRRGI